MGGKILNQFNDLNHFEVLSEIRSQKKYEMELNDKSVFIVREDLLIEPISQEGLSSSGDDNITIGLKLKLTDKLVKEGIVRDIIRQVQTMRKNANFAVEDRIKIFMNVEGLIKEAISDFEDLFKNEVLATELYYDYESGEHNEKFKINDYELHFGIQRNKN